MDGMQIRDRSYKQVEIIRQQNLREQRRLSQQLYSRQGMTAAHNYEIATMSFEQKKLKEELAKIKKTSPTTWGKLPPRDSSQNQTHNNLKKDNKLSDRKMPMVRKTEESVILIDDRKPRLFNKDGIPLPRTNTTFKENSDETVKAKKISLHRINSESKKAEDTIQRFNDTFTNADMDLSPRNIMSSEVGVNDTQQNKNLQSNKKMGDIDKMNTGNYIVSQSNKAMGESDQVNTANDIVSSVVSDKLKTENPQILISVSNKNNSQLVDADLKSAQESISKRLSLKNTDKSSGLKYQGLHNKIQQPRKLSPIPDVSDSVSDSGSQSDPLKPFTLLGTVNTAKKVTEALTKLRNIKTKRQLDEEEKAKQAYKYLPDGSLRTMHKVPDFKKSIDEASKARYIRHKEKQWFEQELSVQQIFDNEA